MNIVILVILVSILLVLGMVFLCLRMMQESEHQRYLVLLKKRKHEDQLHELEINLQKLIGQSRQQNRRNPFFIPQSDLIVYKAGKQVKAHKDMRGKICIDEEPKSNDQKS